MSDGRLQFNKLVRDSIPETMQAKGVAYEIRTLDDAEFAEELLKKAGEEVTELIATDSRENLVKELADVEDVLDELKRLHSITSEELAAAKESAFKKKGGFAQRLFLLWSADDGYKST